MNCKECIDYLEQYRSGELPEATSMLVGEHLSKCSSCAASLRAVAGIERFVALEKGQQPSPFLASRVMARIGSLETSPSASILTRFRPLVFAASVAATIALGILIGSLYQNGTLKASGSADMAFIDDASLESIHLLTSE